MQFLNPYNIWAPKVASKRIEKGKDSRYYQIKTENTFQKKTGVKQNRIYRQKKYM